MERILENGFEATLRSKTNDHSILKWLFCLFGKFLNGEVGTDFWESQANPLKLFKSKVCHMEHFI